MEQSKKKITPLMLAMITLAIIVTLRGLPFLAKYGLSSIFFYLFSALFFLLPVSLIAAELATAWPEKGGVFLWVSKAFGDKWGFMATFLQWIPIVIWYPTALSFIAAAISYLFNPTLAENKFYALAMTLVIYWGATFLNFKGLKTSGWISSFCVLFGTLLPAAIIIFCAAIFLINGHPSEISLSIKNIIPDLSNMQNIVFLAGIFLVFAGMEISAVHVNDVENPQKGYPKAIFLSFFIILTVCILGTLSIAIVVPKDEISLVAGVLQAFKTFFTIFNIPFFTLLMALLISLGAIGQVLALIIGPTKAMLASAQRGDLPPFFKKVNEKNIPTNILLTQGVIVTLISVVFLFMPTVSSSFWMLSVLTIQLYLIMYMLFYAAAIRLRYKYPKQKRIFRVPGKNYGMWIASTVGLVAAVFVFFLSFVPPFDLPKTSIPFFIGFLIFGIILFTLIPLIIYSLKSRWQK